MGNSHCLCLTMISLQSKQKSTYKWNRENPCLSVIKPDTKLWLRRQILVSTSLGWWSRCLFDMLYNIHFAVFFLLYKYVFKILSPEVLHLISINWWYKHNLVSSNSLQLCKPDYSTPDFRVHNKFLLSESWILVPCFEFYRHNGLTWNL